MQQLMKRTQCQPTLGDMCVLLKQHHFDGFNSEAEVTVQLPKHMLCFNTQLGRINTFDEFKNMFALALTDIAWNWLEPFINNIQDMPILKDKIINRFNSWGQILQELCTYWQNMKFNHMKHDIKLCI